MTTNVYDSKAGVMATDSRWSHQFGSRIVYVDDAHFSKIEIFGAWAIMFAGDGVKIQQWKDWIRSGPTDFSLMPDYDGICVCIVSSATKQVRFKQPQDITKDGGYFAGSGSMHAYLCWSVNRDAKRAVESAIQADGYSGGLVKFVNLNDMSNNLSAPGPINQWRIDDVRDAVLQRGMVMNLAQNSGAPFQLSKLAANDAEVAKIQAMIASGEVAPTAPCDGMYTEWTEDQKVELKSALADVFGWSK
ncbi:hypothetical protein ACTJKQ_14250 [Acidovorax sp. 22279]|uniref:hypothetical protein n=1 Tax=Acidovorax sp. 22279 TaxID=3453900 RepID=UPI003F83CE33